MSSPSDPRLQLAAAGGRAGFWLFALTFVLPVLITAVALLAAVLGGGPLKLIGGSLPLTIAATLGGIALLCGVLWWTLSRLMRRQALDLSTDTLEVRSSFYHCRTPLANGRRISSGGVVMVIRPTAPRASAASRLVRPFA